MVPRRYPGRVVFWVGLLSAGLCGRAPARPVETVVLANRNQPASLELAAHYMDCRGIPASNLCTLDLPDGEVISRKTYERRLRDPLLQFLRDGGFVEQEARGADEIGAHETAWLTKARSVRYLVSMYGVPLRIADTKLSLGAKLADRLRKPKLKNEASVDAELALLLAPPYQIGGAQPNPLFRQHRLPEASAPGVPILIAARLDGPSPQAVYRMIDDALEAERFGLHGRGYFDARSLQDEYFIGDFWITEAYERLRREGYDCLIDTNDQVWAGTYPMDDVAIYMGWYEQDAAGPFKRAGFSLQTGAIAYHIHSGSADTLKSSAKAWVGPLLHRGAAASMGAVREPYLLLTPDLQVFMERLCAGQPFGDAAYMATSHLSWQITVVGDPLYTPFKHALEVQIGHLREAGRQGLEWALLRKVNLLVHDGHLRAALALVRKGIEELDSDVLREKLGDLHSANDDYAEAVSTYEAVIASTRIDTRAVRVGAKLIALLHARQRGTDAAAVEDQLRQAWPDSAVLKWLESAVR